MWPVLIGDEYEPEFLALLQEVQDETLVMTRLLLAIRPTAGQAERGHARRLEIGQEEKKIGHGRKPK